MPGGDKVHSLVSDCLEQSPIAGCQLQDGPPFPRLASVGGKVSDNLEDARLEPGPGSTVDWAIGSHRLGESHQHPSLGVLSHRGVG